MLKSEIRYDDDDDNDDSDDNHDYKIAPLRTARKGTCLKHLMYLCMYYISILGLLSTTAD
jgi:hypothetical protein